LRRLTSCWYREREEERAANALGALDPDVAAVALYDPLAYRQPDARSGEIVLAVEPLEHFENPFVVLRGHADAVVFDGKTPLITIPSG
jgi:hypothetical protein